MSGQVFNYQRFYVIVCVHLYTLNNKTDQFIFFHKEITLFNDSIMKNKPGR